MQEQFGLPLVLIIIDTVIAGSGYSKDGQENDASAGQAVMNTLKEVAKRMHCFVFGVDHFGKAVETGTRGTSAKEGSADVVIAMLGDKSVGGEVTNTRLALRKRRGGANGEEHRSPSARSTWAPIRTVSQCRPWCSIGTPHKPRSRPPKRIVGQNHCASCARCS